MTSGGFRTVLLVCVVAIAGCGGPGASGLATEGTGSVSTSPTASSDTTPTPSVDTTRDRTPARRQYPTPPENVTNETATQVALEYEKTLVHDTLSTLSYENFTVGSDDQVHARILNRSADGTYVRTTVEFHYSMGIESYGCIQRATYFVNRTAISRVGGTDMTPLCSQ